MTNNFASTFASGPLRRESRHATICSACRIPKFLTTWWLRKSGHLSSLSSRLPSEERWHSCYSEIRQPPCAMQRTDRDELRNK